MTKFIITTTQPVIRKYYVEVDNVEWAYDGIVMQELEEFSQQFGSEDIIDSHPVEDFPAVDANEARLFNVTVNAAAMKFNHETDQWELNVRWDLDK